MRILSLIAAAVLSVAPLTGALAEPQILGMLAQNEPITLNCSGGECFAEFSAFCMEPNRASPSHNTAYVPAEGAALTLIARATDGSVKEFPAADLASFRNVRGYAAVRVSVDAGILADLGAEGIALKVGERVALLPLPKPEFRRPHEPGEVALALGPRRALGERIVDRGGSRADGARLIGRMINALPESSRVGAEVRSGLWRATVEGAGYADASGSSVAGQAFEYCLAKDPDDTGFTLRQCLERRHDWLIWSLNREYWASVGGS